MQEALLVTTTIAVFLFVGVLCSFVANKLKLPDMLLLILAGMLFGRMQFKGESLVQFPEVFLSSVSILALAMIVFDSTARIRLRELDTFSLKAIRLMFIFTVLVLALFSTAAYFILDLPFWSSLLFATLMVGTSPEALLPLASKAREVVLVMLTGVAIKMPITADFFIASGLLFTAYLAIRFIATYLSVHAEGYSLGEILYITLNAPKGIATATVIFSLLFFNIEGLTLILDMTFAFILYTVLLSSIVTWLYENYLGRHKLPHRVRKA